VRGTFSKKIGKDERRVRAEMRMGLTWRGRAEFDATIHPVPFAKAKFKTFWGREEKQRQHLLEAIQEKGE